VAEVQQFGVEARDFRFSESAMRQMCGEGQYDDRQKVSEKLRESRRVLFAISARQVAELFSPALP